MNRARAASFSPPRVRGKVRRLGIILGDQLDRRALLLEQIDKKADAILMMEVIEESQHVISHKQRIALFLSAMRHFALDLKEAGFRVHYVSLSDNLGHAFPDVLASCTRKFACNEWLVTEPGEWRVLRQLEEAARASDTSLTILDDHHFLSDRAHFAQWMKNRKQPVMEHFYRAERKRLDILMQEDGTPEAGQWNFDKDNRQTFKTKPDTRKPYTPRNDEITREVIACVADEFADHPGELDGFRWAVTRDQALRVLDDFIDHRLPDFGTFQDAMWEDEPFLNHSLLSPAINLKLLHPRE
ncbi:MAG: cryptochrome/photolyase family protein, partial [Phycisphaerae bacterium]